MRYRLTINRIEPNPKYDPDSRYQQGAVEIESQVLQMEVTPEQFDRIRNACLEVAK